MCSLIIQVISQRPNHPHRIFKLWPGSWSCRFLPFRFCSSTQLTLTPSPHELPLTFANFPSVLSKYPTKSSMVHTFRPHFLPKAKHPSLLIMPGSLLSAFPSTSVPYSTISEITTTSLLPASLQKSTVASVCPFRSLTPPTFARNGNTWPGRRKLAPVAVFAASVVQVRARSCADMPVVVKGESASMETV
jgi:hypothetical protein